MSPSEKLIQPTDSEDSSVESDLGFNIIHLIAIASIFKQSSSFKRSSEDEDEMNRDCQFMTFLSCRLCSQCYIDLLVRTPYSDVDTCILSEDTWPAISQSSLTLIIYLKTEG